VNVSERITTSRPSNDYPGKSGFKPAPMVHRSAVTGLTASSSLKASYRVDGDEMN
jgi:hypothetical protein